MKKKMLLYLITGCLTAAVLGGCSSKGQSESVNTEFEAKQEESEKVETEGKEEEFREEEEKEDYAHPPILGEEDIQDYDGYAYLQWKLLTSDSGEAVEVYLPMDEDAYESESTISGYDMGISYSVELDPFISGEDQKIHENLDDYLEDIYDPEYNEDYYDVAISDAERIDSDTAYATAEYCKYYEYDGSYCAVFATYLLKRLDNDVTVLLEVKISSDDVDSETEYLIGELITFYQCEIDWSEERAEEKIKALSEDGAAFGGSLAFDIPEEWSRDETESTDDAYVYAPYGDASAAECFVSISREYTGMDASEIEILESNREFLVDMVKAQLENEDAFDGDVSFYEDTDLGLTVKAQLKGEDEDGIMTEVHMYWIFNEEYAYIISAAQHGDAALYDPFAVAEGILLSARME